jgi:fatty acid desaturase
MSSTRRESGFASNSAPRHLGTIDRMGFARELDEIRSKIVARVSPADLHHLQRLEWRGRAATVAGYLLAPLSLSSALVLLLSAFLISLGMVTRWMVAHHVLHRGYDAVPGVPERYTSKCFGRGWRRFIDWFDWIIPEAWAHEHNVLHHYDTGGPSDPDLVERHLEMLRVSSLPLYRKYLYVAALALTWKWSYYAPQTMTVLFPQRATHKNYAQQERVTYRKLFRWEKEVVRRLWLQCYLPFFSVHFVMIPLLFSPFGAGVVFSVLVTRILAEFLTNLHTFLVIGPNHSGDDLYRFDRQFSDKEEFYLSQVLGSVNFRTGGDLNDHLHKFLNYQIEHHLFPDVPLRQYQLVQPEVKALCQRYGVPYVQDSVWRRAWMLVQICVGVRTMKRVAGVSVGELTGVTG